MNDKSTKVVAIISASYSITFNTELMFFFFIFCFACHWVTLGSQQASRWQQSHQAAPWPASAARTHTQRSEISWARAWAWTPERFGNNANIEQAAIHIEKFIAIAEWQTIDQPVGQASNTTRPEAEEEKANLRCQRDNRFGE